MKLKIAQYEELLNLTADLEYDFVTSRIVADFSDKIIGTTISVYFLIDSPAGAFHNCCFSRSLRYL